MNDIRFIVAIKEAEQLAFDGVNKRVDIYASRAHIAHRGSILCGMDKGRLKTEGVKRIGDTKLRPEGVLMCEECERLFKANSQLPWYQWEKNILHGVNK